MLRSIVFQNMINFKEKQCLNFDKGVNFLIGANATGKSSILELIRRCHSDSLSSSVSNLQDVTQPGYIICKYEKCSDSLRDTTKAIKGIETDVALLCYFQEKEAGRPDTIYKCVCLRGSSTEKHGEKYLIAVSLRNNGINRELGFRECNDSEVHKLLKVYFENKAIDSKKLELNKELKLFHFIKSDLQVPVPQDTLTCHTKDILDSLGRSFALIFATRSFGPLQWINGNTVREGELNANTIYKKAQDRAKILRELLPTDQTAADATDDRCTTVKKKQKLRDESAYIDQEKEKLLFDRMTYPLKYEYKKTKEKITVTMKDDKTKAFELLKAPEGVIEAKQASLVLSHTQFKTICYEDIDRGMHNQMIENLNNLVLKNIDDKTVIIVTHNSSFLTGWAMEKTHICSRERTEEILNVVRKVPKGYKFAVHEEMKKTLFSARVLLVEGTTDQQILQPLFQFIIEHDDAQKILAKFLMKEQQTIVSQICKTQIIPFGGSGMENAIKFCDKVNIPVLSFRDADADTFKFEHNKNDHLKWTIGTIEDVLKNDCPKTVRKTLSKTPGPKDLDMFMEKAWKENYKGALKNLIKKGFEDDTYVMLYKELFAKVKDMILEGKSQEEMEKTEMLAFLSFVIKRP